MKRARLPLAALAVSALVASLATATGAGAAPSSPTSPAPQSDQAASAAGITAKSRDLMKLAKDQRAMPRMLGKSAPAGVEPGGTTQPAGLPSSGNYAFLVQTRAASTLSAYQSARSRGTSPAAAGSAAKAQFSRIKASQNAVIAALPRGSRVLYKTHSVLSGVAVLTDVHNFGALQAISGVQAVYPIAPKKISNSYAMPLQGAPAAWTAHSETGANSTIAVIDTGIDYTHSNFGGPGTVNDYDVARTNDTAAPDHGAFSAAKFATDGSGNMLGIDLAGDTYNADPSDPSTYQPVPHPDPNPLDCNSHGSHVAGTAAGYGLNSDGTTYTGAYDNSTPFGSMRIGPGMAPGAKLIAYKVFGCDGSTDLVSQAIDRAADPNNDGNPADHVSVINMSLGSDYSSPQDADAWSANAASALGISVVVASGNGGDFYDIGGSPGNAVRTIAVANSVDAYSQLDTLTISAPGNIAGDYGAQRSVAYDWAADPDLGSVAGGTPQVVKLTDTTNLDGCDPLNTTDAAAVSGKIAFLEWTDDDTQRRCGSVARSANLVTAGAKGFIFADDSETFAAGITGSAAIPGVMVVKSAGDFIRTELAAGHTVTVGGTSAGTFNQSISGNDDLVNTSSSRGVRGAGNVKPDVTAVGTSVFSTAMGTGNQGQSDTGTSMATPMVAGLSALVRSMHPGWTPEQVKADIMNTAGQDLFTGTNHTGTKYAPNRVGAGRIKADKALDNSVLAYVANDPGAVSVSFGPVAVTAPITLHKTINVVNTSNTAASYNVSYDALTAVPGVAYTVSPSAITVGANSSTTVTVTLTIANPAALTKTHDPTVALTYGTGQNALPREFLADASGRVLLASVGGARPDLRVPVYSAPRPASTMTQTANLTLPHGTVQSAQLTLAGHGITQGSGAAAIRSAVSGFALKAVSGLARTCTVTITSGCVHFPDERSADLKYVGDTSNTPQVRALGGDPLLDGTAYFAITTQGPWRTAASSNEFDIMIDTNGDNDPDAVLFNTRLDGLDVFVSELVDLTTPTPSIVDIEAINDRVGDTDTALFDSDTMVLPVAIGALPHVTAGHPRIHYGVMSFGPGGPNAVDAIGVNPGTGVLSHSLTLDVLRPSLAVYGALNPAASTVLFRDLPGARLTVRRDLPAYTVDHTLGALMVHFHNKVGAKASVVNLRSASSVGLRLSTTRAHVHWRVGITVGVANSGGPVPTGQVVVTYTGPSRGTITHLLHNGSLTFTIPVNRTGRYTFTATYRGDSHYLRGTSRSVVLTVV